MTSFVWSRNNVDYIKYVYKYLLAIPLQVQTVTDHSKLNQSESVCSQRPLRGVEVFARWRV